jgi:hypothetical protein
MAGFSLLLTDSELKVRRRAGSLRTAATTIVRYCIHYDPFLVTNNSNSAASPGALPVVSRLEVLPGHLADYQ